MGEFVSAAGGVMRYLSFALLLLQLSFTAAADNGSELEKLYSALNMLNQQQQAIYQQFQMVQELRRSGSGSVPLLYGTPMYPPLSGEIANYDEVVAAQKSAALRGEYLYQQADQLLAKYNEIEEMKKPLQLRIYDLSLKAE